MIAAKDLDAGDRVRSQPTSVDVMAAASRADGLDRPASNQDKVVGVRFRHLEMATVRAEPK